MSRKVLVIANETVAGRELMDAVKERAEGGEVLVVAPAMDKDAVAGDVRRCVDEVEKIYRLYGATDRLQLSAPDDYNRFSTEMREKAYLWLRERAAASR